MNTVELTKAHIMEMMSTRSIPHEEHGYVNQHIVEYHDAVEKIRLTMLPAFEAAVSPVLEMHLLPNVYNVQNYRALEIGCATGFFYRRIAPKWLNQRMTCLDINPESLAAFRERDKDAQLLQGSIYSMPLADETFDSMIGYSALDGSLFLGEAVKDVKRVLKKGGLLVLFQDLMTDMYLLKGETENPASAVTTVERYHERLTEEIGKAGFEMLEGDEFLYGFAREHVDEIRKRTGAQIPFLPNLEWDRGVYNDTWGLRKVDYYVEGSVVENIKMRYAVAVKPA